MKAIRTARERAREELTREIKEAARRQLAVSGADGLSLRGVARELGMVSSAIYRYFPSRDDLLTALIIDAYDAVGAAAELADDPVDRRDLLCRWRLVCQAIRKWAVAHPREYALIYGSTIPGYKAPQDTVAPAARVPLVLMGIVSDGWRFGTLRPPSAAPPVVSSLAAQLDQINAALDIDLPAAVLARGMVAWTQLFGMLSFELTGQFVGSVDPADEFFDYAVREMAAFLGLS